MSDYFVKIYGTILDSSVWGEPHATVRVWIAMLVMADQNGVVSASHSGLARRANVTADELAVALITLESPDPDSRSPEHEGRRIEKIRGGWLVLNARSYRDLRTDKQIADAERQQQKRERDKSRDDRDMSQESRDESPEVEVEVELEPTKDSTQPTARAKPYDELLSLLGDEDLPWLLGKLEARGQAGYAWVSEIKALLDGLHGPKVSVEHMKQAIHDYNAALPSQASLRHFRAFVKSAVLGPKEEGAYTAARRVAGQTLKAATLIAKLRKKRLTNYPNAVPPNWADELEEWEEAAVHPFLARIFADDPKGEGTLVAQLARALEEAR